MSSDKVNELIREAAEEINKIKDRAKKEIELSAKISLLVVLTTETPVAAMGVLENVKFSLVETTREEIQKKSG